MGFNPLQEKGIPLEQQIRNGRDLNVEPADPDTMDPYTRCRVITMNGIEVEAFSGRPPRSSTSQTWLEQLLLHEYNECYLYCSFLEQESDPRSSRCGSCT